VTNESAALENNNNDENNNNNNASTASENKPQKGMPLSIKELFPFPPVTNDFSLVTGGQRSAFGQFVY
jgi:hypothetical protein